MSYDLTIHFGDQGGDGPGIRALLDAEPAVGRVDENSWVFTPVESIHVEFDAEPHQENTLAIAAIRVHIPFSLLEASTESALLLSFELAERFGGRVYDDQMGDYITPENPDETAAAHVDYLVSMQPLCRMPSRFDDYSQGGTRQSILVMVVILLLSLFGALGVIYTFDIPENKAESALLIVGVVLALVLFSAKDAIDSWRG